MTMTQAAKGVKFDLVHAVAQYPEETALDHLDAILDEVRRELKPFCDDYTENLTDEWKELQAGKAKRTEDRQ